MDIDTSLYQTRVVPHRDYHVKSYGVPELIQSERHLLPSGEVPKYLEDLLSILITVQTQRVQIDHGVMAPAMIVIGSVQ